MSICSSDFERELWNQGYKKIAGVDEVGRGAWAGPVVTAAVIFAPDKFPSGLNDSKKLSASRREFFFGEIKSTALAFSFGQRDAQIIDQINIAEATRQAMYSAVTELSLSADYLLVDAVKLSNLNIPQQNIIHGDALSVSIAAASIIAKVHRDQIMVDFDKLYPEYGFARHKGYGTKEHQAALAKLGPCLIHRKTFRGVLIKS